MKIILLVIVWAAGAWLDSYLPRCNVKWRKRKR